MYRCCKDKIHENRFWEFKVQIVITLWNLSSKATYKCTCILKAQQILRTIDCKLNKSLKSSYQWKFSYWQILINLKVYLQGLQNNTTSVKTLLLCAYKDKHFSVQNARGKCTLSPLSCDNTKKMATLSSFYSSARQKNRFSLKGPFDIYNSKLLLFSL